MYPHNSCLALVVLASLMFFGSGVCAQEPVSPVELLGRQPDFVAEEIISSVEQHGATGQVSGYKLLFKRAKQGKFYRTETGTVTLFKDATKPDGGLWFEGAQYVESFVRKEGIKFEAVGTEQVQGHNCIKIKATQEAKVTTPDHEAKGAKPAREAKKAKPDHKAKRAKPGEEEAVYFYVAQDLRNLVIAIQVFTPRRSTSYVLRNISFDVPADLFKDAATHVKQISGHGLKPHARQRIAHLAGPPATPRGAHALRQKLVNASPEKLNAIVEPLFRDGGSQVRSRRMAHLRPASVEVAGLNFSFQTNE